MDKYTIIPVNLLDLLSQKEEVNRLHTVFKNFDVNQFSKICKLFCIVFDNPNEILPFLRLSGVENVQWYQELTKKLTGSVYSPILSRVNFEQNDTKNSNIDSTRNKESYETLHIGFDSEWFSVSNKNMIISYQFYITELDLGIVWFIQNRKDLKGMLDLFYTMLIDKLVFKDIKNIKFISHWFTAEFSAMDWRKTAEIIRFVKIRNSLFGKKQIKYVTPSRNVQHINIFFNDTFLLSNAGLAEIAKSIGLAKLEHNYIETMNKMVIEEPLAYILYSMNDSVISALWYQKFMNGLNNLNIDTKKVEIVTASQVAKELIKNIYSKEHKNEYRKYIGYKEVTRQVFDNKTKKIRNVKNYYLERSLYEFEDAYHGGFNQCFKAGYYPQIFFDYDIQNCYPLTLLAFEEVDWTKKIYINKYKLDTLKFNDIGLVALKYFKFREGIEPNFLIKTQYGLITVREHMDIKVTVQEFLTAYKNNWLDMFDIDYIFIYPKTGERILSEEIAFLIKERSKYKDTEIENAILKLIPNSAYGDFAEGINPKSSLNITQTIKTGTEIREEQRQGSIFNPAIASYITGVASSLLLEFINKYKKHVYVATTDGFTADIEISNLKYAGWLSKHFSEVREKMVGDPNVIKLKHRGRGFLSWKTRGYTMLKKIENSKLLTARGGIQTKEVTNAIRYLLELYLHRNPQQTYNEKSLTPLSEIIVRNEDLNEIESIKHTNFDYDLKRKVVSYKDFGKFLQIDTEPYQTLEEFSKVKNNYYQFEKTTKNQNKITNSTELTKFFAYVKFREYADFKQIVNVEDYTSYFDYKLIKYLLSENKSVKEIADILKLDYHLVYMYAKRFENNYTFIKVGEELLEFIKSYMLLKNIDINIIAKITNFDIISIIEEENKTSVKALKEEVENVNISDK